MNPEEAVQFIEDMRSLRAQIDEPTVPISLRIPANLLRSLKAQSKLQGRKYQSMIVDFIRKGLEDK